MLVLAAQTASVLPTSRTPSQRRRFVRPSGARRPTRQHTPPAAMSKFSKAELQALPGVAAEQDPATKGYVMQQTMLRVKDPERTLAFYTGVLGMTLLTRFDFADMKFSLYFVGYADPAEIPEDPVERGRWLMGVPGCIELTHNWGTESDPDFKGYHNGNTEPRGFGHIGVTVPDVMAACKRFEQLGVEFVKRPEDGKMKNIAFIKDPDGYWIEILGPENAEMIVNWEGNSAQ